MAGRGPAPKEKHVRSRDDADLERIEVLAVEPLDLSDDLLPAGESWHPATLRWWNTWRASPLAENLPAVDWCELEACAVLHHEFMRKRTFTLASELRLRVAKFGATPEDRMRLKLKIDTPTKPDRPAGVTDISARRQRLTG